MFLSSIVLCVLSTACSNALPKEDDNATTTESQTASVQEVSQPPMMVQNASPQDYLLPAYYTFNKGEPFTVEKDPLTGTIDFNKKTTPTSEEKVESNTSSGVVDEKGSSSETESDYFYDDQEFPEDEIDRKDGSIEGPNIYRPNDIFQNPYKISPDLHQFLNLPVHYSSSGKFPLISSSYANTKIQGTGSSSGYSNHKYVTSSTQSPSYYTMPTTKYSSQKPQYQSTTFRTTTNHPTTTPTSTTMEAVEEYENTDYEYEGEDVGTPLDNQAVPSEQHTYKPDTTRYTVTTYRPTKFQFTTTTTTIEPTTYSARPTTEKPKQQVSIVTSLPLDVYYSKSQESTVKSTSTTSSPTPQSTTPSSTTVNFTKAIASSTEASTTKLSTEPHMYNQNPPYNVPTEGFYLGFGEEPFRPIFGPSDTPIKHESNNQIHYNKHDTLKPKPTDFNEFHRLPPHQNIPYIQRPASPTLLPQMEPPRLDATHSFFPNQPVKLVPGQHTSISVGDSSKTNTITRPIQENIYERRPPPSFNKEPKPQHSATSHKRPDSHPIYDNRPSERPISSVKPRPAVDIPIKSNFKMPSKVESHYIKVSPDQENPSYSLQTSFSIGIPASPTQGDKDQSQGRPGQGVGQVFFPDNTPAENSPADASVNLPSQVLRPPSTRVPIQSYQPNRPGFRPPIHIQARPPPPPFRVPNDDLQPPSGETDNYPRPHWENHSKPFYSPTQNAIPKKDIVLPQNYPGLSREKPENIQRPDLPNILPQFRPNAKLGHVDHQPFSHPGERLREPLDTLQPPPLPQPQHLRINRNDDESEIDREITSAEIKGDPLEHRRSGPQLPRVTTLQMMQQNPQRKTGMHPEFPLENRQSPDKDKPVFLVFPSAHGMSHKPQKPTPEEVVVIGTRAQRPLPPANLEKDDLDSFSLDDNKHFPIPGRDRVDTPVLKTKISSKPLVKNEFPYLIVKPYGNNNIPEERILATGTITKEYTAFSPTPASSTEDNKEHDSEINLIPYLQDYMPFATKKPQVLVKSPINSKKDTKVPQKPIPINQVISTTLNASLATTTAKISEKVDEKKTESQEKNGQEMTVSATMYTQHRPTNHKVPVTYTPSEPQPLGFQAPFMASLSAPESQGWSVVTDKNMKPTSEVQEESRDTEVDDSKFDIENFKPQLFGGFKPILPSSNEESGDAVSESDNNKDVLLNKGDREEKAL